MLVLFPRIRRGLLNKGQWLVRALVPHLDAFKNRLLDDAIADRLRKVVGDAGMAEQFVLLELNRFATGLRPLLGLRRGAGLLEQRRREVDLEPDTPWRGAAPVQLANRANPRHRFGFLLGRVRPLA